MSPQKLLFAMICGLIGLTCQSMYAQSTKLEGSWELTFAPSTSTPSAGIPGLATFAAGGTTVETDATQFVPAPVAPGTATVFGSPGHGTWQQGPALVDFIVDFESDQATAAGSLFARRAYQLIVTPNAGGTQFSGSYTIVTTPVSGPSTTTTGTIAGKKLQVLPPPSE